MVLAACGMVIGGMSSLAIMKTVLPFGSSILIFAIYLAMAIIYYFPVNYLYQFSKQLKSALAYNNSSRLSSAIENLKSHYKFIVIGIMIIVMLAIYAIMFMFAIVVGLSNLGS